MSSAIDEYITFYHEQRIPQNKFFDKATNVDSNTNVLVVSSPSRMGNHLVMSLLDNHPEVPRLPGEDGFLSFSFLQANYDVQQFLSSIKGSNSLEFLTKLGSNNVQNKWHAFKNCFKTGRTDLSHSGTQESGGPSILDYEGLVFDVNYQAYEDFLKAHLEQVRSANSYNEVFTVYLQALQLLDFDPIMGRFDSYICFGGMRVQLKWICETFLNAKVVCSLRSFESYADAHIRANYGDVPYTPCKIQESWEHWYHKTIDAMYLKLRYPEKIGLVTYEDLIFNTTSTVNSLCDFLGISHNESMRHPSVFGIPVRGNSASSRLEKQEGVIYQPTKLLDPKFVPQQSDFIWSELQNMTVNYHDLAAFGTEAG